MGSNDSDTEESSSSSNEKKATMKTLAKEGIEASGPREKDPRKKPPETS